MSYGEYSRGGGGYGASNGASNGYSGGYSNGYVSSTLKRTSVTNIHGSGGYSNGNSYGGGGGGGYGGHGAGGDRMSNLGQGLKKQTWGIYLVFIVMMIGS